MYSHQVTLFELDLFGRLRPSYLMRFAIHGCSKQLDEEGIPGRIASGLSSRTGWMLARMTLEEQQPIFEGDNLDIFCSCRQQSGAAYLREIHILRDGEQVASSRLLWMLVDLDGRHILRPKELEILFAGIPTAEGILPVPRTVLPEEMREYGSHQVRYSECDKNGHYSSPNYIDLICDRFDFWKDSGKGFHSLQIDYHSEFLPEEKLEILGSAEEDCIAVRGQHADGNVGFTAILKTKQICS